MLRTMVEKRIKEVSTRTCVHCGKEWIVRERKTPKFVQLLCSDCLSTLDKYLIYLYRDASKYNTTVTYRNCINCGKEFPLVVHPNNNRLTKLFCRDCESSLTGSERRSIKIKNNPEYKQKCLAQKRESRRRNIVHAIWKAAYDRAKNKNIEFNIEESDIVIPKYCPILEVPIVLGSKGDYEYSPSIDRIDNSKGYIKGNVQIISKKANSMKNSASFNELQTFCKNVLRYSLNTTENECSESKDKEP